MNILLGTLAYIVVTFPLAVLWHMKIFRTKYMAWRYFGEDVKPILGLSSMIVQGIVLSYGKAFGAGQPYSGHRFIFSEVNKNETRIDHEMIMLPKEIFKLMLPIMMMVGRKNVRGLAEALPKYLEDKKS